MEKLHTIRKQNLQDLVLRKFAGNKSALARAADVHHNHINLLLSSNDVHRRNMGEELARRIEQTLGLPPLWLDQDHSGDEVVTQQIAAFPIGEGLDRILKLPPVLSITVSIGWLESISPNITGTSQLFLSAIATDEVAPLLQAGDVVLIDAGVKAFTVDGVYLLATGEDVYMRSIRKSISGGYAVSGAGGTDQLDNIKGMKVLGRVVQKILISRI